MQHVLESITLYGMSVTHYDRAIELLSYKKKLNGERAYTLDDMHQVIFQEDYHANIAAVLKYHEQLILWGFSPSDIISIASHKHAHTVLDLWVAFMFNHTPTTQELLGLYYFDADLTISHIVDLFAHHQNVRNWHVMLLLLTLVNTNTQERIIISHLHPHLTLQYIIEFIQHNHHDNALSMMQSFRYITLLLEQKYQLHALRQISYRQDGAQRLKHLLECTKQYCPNLEKIELFTEVALTYPASQLHQRCQEAMTLHALSSEEWQMIETEFLNEEDALDDDFFIETLSL